MQPTNKLNYSLKKNSSFVHQLKMPFNPDKSKQAQELRFPPKIQKLNHLPVIVNNITIHQLL